MTVFYRLDKQDEAAVWLEKGFIAGNADAEDAVKMASIMRIRKEWEKAEEACQYALRLGEDDLEAYVEAACLARARAEAAVRGVATAHPLICVLKENKKPRLSLCMIVKDEAENLPRCLESARDTVDEIIVVDTGSTDNTPEIALRYGARVFHYTWQGDFAAARNYSLDQATGEWILCLDADEELRKGDGVKLRSLLNISGVEGYCFPVVNFYGRHQGFDYMTDLVCRLFRNRRSYRFQRAIHEQVVDLIAAFAGEASLKTADVQIRHYGYLHSAMY
ncbi:MAG: glycosyltransferase family 2 protein [Dethiobacter sp.]|jgi:hypothetical protein|nr:glycosyltransferase family 2 protein [Dethiobacter sp.]